MDKAVTAVFERIEETGCEGNVMSLWEDGAFVAFQLNKHLLHLFQAYAGEEKAVSILLCEEAFEALRSAFRELERRHG